MIKDIRHTGIVVADLEASLFFYKDCLGFHIVKIMEESGEYIDNILSLKNAKITTIKLSSPSGQLIELLKFHTQHSNSKSRRIYEIGISHIAFTVDDIETEYMRLKKMGIKFNSPPRLSPDGYAKVAFCIAPEGTFIELVQVL